MSLRSLWARHAIVHAGAWPTPEQELLLRACLCEGAAAIEAWHAWRARTDLDRIDSASYRLIPLLHGNLRRCGVEPKDIATYRSIHRKTWYENQLLRDRVAPILSRLRAAGHDVMLLKGAALAWSCYEDPGERPMEDVDLLVRTQEADVALGRLVRWGFTPVGGLGPTDVARQRVLRHAWQLQAPKGHGPDLDFHWHALARCVRPGADDAFWTAAMPLHWGSLQLAMLCPADQLLQVCLHGLEPNPMPPVRWIADATMILRRAAGAVDWERLLVQAQERRVALLLGHALDYLRRLVAAPIPEPVTHALLSAPAEAWERSELRSCEGKRAFTEAALNYVHRYRRLRASSQYWREQPALLRYVRYLERLWRLDHPSEIPGYVMRKALQR